MLKRILEVIKIFYNKIKKTDTSLLSVFFIPLNEKSN